MSQRSSLVTGSKLYFPWVAVRLQFRTCLDIGISSLTCSTVRPIVCLGPTVMSNRACTRRYKILLKTKKMSIQPAAPAPSWIPQATADWAARRPGWRPHCRCRCGSSTVGNSRPAGRSSEFAHCPTSCSARMGGRTRHRRGAG